MILSGSSFGGAILLTDVSGSKSPIQSIPGIRAWWDANDSGLQRQSSGGALATPGDPLGEWKDRVAAIALTESGSARPIVSTVSGRRVIVFDGVTSQMFAPDLVGTGFQSAGALSVIFTPLTAITYGTPVGFQDGGPAISRLGTGDNYGACRPGVEAPAASSYVGVGVRTILTVVWIGLRYTVYVAGSAPVTQPYDFGAYTSTNPFSLARHVLSGYSRENMNMEGALAFDQPITVESVNIIEQEYS